MPAECAVRLSLFFTQGCNSQFYRDNPLFLHRVCSQIITA
ncbi:hypothetical protein DEDE109153_17165 [Deinococcus deserti]